MADDRKGSRIDESRDRIEDEQVRGIAEEGADEFEDDVDIDDVEVVDEQPDEEDDETIF